MREAVANRVVLFYKIKTKIPAMRFAKCGGRSAQRRLLGKSVRDVDASRPDAGADEEAREAGDGAERNGDRAACADDTCGGDGVGSKV